jgi:hypothetical protein
VLAGDDDAQPHLIGKPTQLGDHRRQLDRLRSRAEQDEHTKPAARPPSTGAGTLCG